MVNMMDSILENRKIVERYCLFDDLMMSKTFEDINCVSYLLGTIFHRDDLEIVDVRSQFEVRNLQGKSIRLDIFAIDKDGVIYDIEVQRENSQADPQRARYYSSMLDGNILDKGKEHKELPETHVIFITQKDYKDEGLPIYSVKRKYDETNEDFDDKVHIYYVNGEYQDDTPLGRLMHDFFCRDADDMYCEVIAERFGYLKKAKEGQKEMDDLLEAAKKREWDKGRIYGKKEGKLEGKIEGKIEGKLEGETEKTIQFVKRMNEDGLNIEIIAKYAGLSVKEVMKII